MKNFYEINRALAAKKRSLLILCLFLGAIVANAATVNVSPGTKALYNAYKTAAANDVLVLAAGTYDETERIVFDKSITIQAAADAAPIVKFVKDNQIKSGASVKFVGIKFDGSAMTGEYEYALRSYDATAGNKICLDKCEVTGFASSSTNYFINAHNATRTLDSIIITNCYFHDTKGDAVYVGAGSAEQETCQGVIIKNSTFANITPYHSVIDVNNYGNTVTPNIEVTVDHCTFYNNPTTADGYAGIRSYKSTKVNITNCIFAHSESYAKCGTYCYGGNVTNCLAYNLTSGTNGHRSSGVTLTNNVTADPLFTNAAAGNLTLSASSPALFAATDNSHLGDPRWWPAVPSTDFSSPYVFTGAAATISGNIWKTDDANQYLYGDGDHYADYGTAQWQIHANRACYLQVVLNVASTSTSTHQYKVEVFNTNNVLVGEAFVESGTGTSATGDIILPGILYLPVGNYRVKLSNLTAWSSATIESVTFAYAGGAVQNLPGTTVIGDAWFSAEGTRADGKIDFPNGTIQDGWVKWNVAFASAANYNVTVNANNGNGHNYTVALYTDEDDPSPIFVTEGGQQESTGSPNAIDLGALEVPAGNYILKVTNSVQWSDAELLSVTFTYAGGGAVDLAKDAPATLLPNADVVLSDDWSIEDSKITHAESKATTGWAKWNVNCEDAANYNVTVNIESDNGHLIRVEVFEDESAIYTLNETESTHWSTGTLAINLGNIDLGARNYIFKVSNTQSSSHVQIVSVDISYVGGAIINLPGTLPLTDAMLSTKAYRADGMLYFAPHDCGTIPDEWATWNLHVTDANAYQFTVNTTSPNGQKYQILITDSEDNEVYRLAHTSSLGSGDRSFTSDIIYLASGNYTLEMRNIYPYSDGHLVSISAAVAENVIVFDEAAESNSVIATYDGTNTNKILLKRSFRAGMYNTVCLPFNVSSGSEMTNIFGEGYELLELDEATVEGEVLTLSFTTPASNIYHGHPYLIKPTKDVLNPIFNAHTISKSTSYNTVEKTNASFIGTFIKQNIAADENNLYLGSNNALYFSSEAVTIKGLRAYFAVDPSAGAPTRARIVKQEETVTEVELVEGALPEAFGNVQKLIENGQLIIVKDGAHYNAFGVRVK